MEKEKAIKYDANQEIVQMRAQWAKQENCRLQWHDNWGWLLEEQAKRRRECKALRKAAHAAMPHHYRKPESKRSLKPVPETTTGFIGWLAAKPECRLEVYTSWLAAMHVPIRLPDAWDKPEYYDDKK